MECHPKRWWNFFLSENEKKEIEPIFTEKCFSAQSTVVYSIGVMKHFSTQTLDTVQ